MDYDFRLQTRARACRCRDCPPDRVCAWDCVQGMNTADIVIGATLALERQVITSEPEEEEDEFVFEGLWRTYN